MGSLKHFINIWHNFGFYPIFILNPLIMKQRLQSGYKPLSIIFLSVLLSIFTFAQDSKVDININKGGNSGNFFASPWVWVIGGALFILLLVALMRGGGNKSN